MKKIVFILSLIMLGLCDVAFCGKKADLDTLWHKGNNLYTEGKYNEAIDLYNKIVNDGYESSALYYNMGNAYFKDGNIGKSILYYNKALILNPMDHDIEHNLYIAESMTINRIEPIPEFIMVTWYKNLRASLSSNTWTVISLIAFGLTLSGILLFLLSTTVGKRKLSFTFAVIMLLLSSTSLMFAVYQKNIKLSGNDAIVMSSAEAVKSSPDKNGKDIFILNEGAKVKIVDRVGNWCDIVVASGNRGWISASSIELID